MQIMSSLKDKIWLWGQTPNGHHRSGYPLPGENKMTPTEALDFFGIKNNCRVKLNFEPELSFFDDPYLANENTEKICLSVLGAGGEIVELNDTDAVIALSKKEPRIVAAVMDDLIGTKRINVYTAEVIRGIRERLHNEPDNRIELWSVFYDTDLSKPISDKAREFDVTTYWNWFGESLYSLDEDVKKMREIADGRRIMLGMYMFDYGNKKPYSDSDMKMQIDLMQRKLEDGEIEGIILCSNCIADIGLSAVDITKKWLDELK